MKGVLFNVVEDVVTDVMSADVWDEVIDASGASGAYTSLGNYPDAELVGIVGGVADAAALSVDDTLRLAGQRGFDHLARRNPGLIEEYAGWRDVLLALDDIIHPEVMKIYPGAAVPRFTVVDDGDELVIDYSSARALCALADGLIVGCGAHYGATVTVTHDACVHRGDDACRLRAAESS